MIRTFTPILLTSLAAALAACSPERDEAAAPDAGAAVIPAAAGELPGAPEAATDPQVLRLEGLGDLVIGEAIPAGSSFAARGAQIPDSDCVTLSSPDYTGVYAIAERGIVRRITLSDEATVRLVEGIGPGASEEEVRAAFPGFTTEGHKYADAPAKYLTQPGSDPRLRFEIGTDGKVSAVHAGIVPQLLYVEGCA